MGVTHRTCRRTNEIKAAAAHAAVHALHGLLLGPAVPTADVLQGRLPTADDAIATSIAALRSQLATLPGKSNKNARAKINKKIKVLEAQQVTAPVVRTPCP